MLRGMEPPPRVKLKVTWRLAPPPTRGPEDAVARFLTIQDGIQRRLASANDLDLVGVKVRSPVVSWLHYRLGFAFAFLAAHERRHLWQAWQVRRAQGSPD